VRVGGVAVAAELGREEGRAAGEVRPPTGVVRPDGTAGGAGDGDGDGTALPSATVDEEVAIGAIRTEMCETGEGG
jgi:hypothetical protein